MEIVDKNWLTLKRSSDKKINLNEEHRGGVIIASSFIFNNRYYDNTAYVSIPWSTKS